MLGARNPDSTSDARSGLALP